MAIGIFVSSLLGALFGLEEMRRQHSATTLVGNLLRNHLEGDMMHDAIRADVLAAFSGRQDPKAAEEQLAEHVEWFHRVTRANVGVQTTPQLMRLMRENEPVRDRYMGSAQHLMRAWREKAPDLAQAEAAFQEAFVALEKDNEALSDAMQAEFNAAEDSVKALSDGLRQLLIGGTVVGCLLIS